MRYDDPYLAYSDLVKCLDTRPAVLQILFAVLSLSQGCVYLKMESLESAIGAYQALHGGWYKGKVRKWSHDLHVSLNLSHPSCQSHDLHVSMILPATPIQWGVT